MEYQKTTEAAGDLIGNKIADKITEVSKNLQQNYSETVTNANNKEIRKEKYIFKRKKVIDNIIFNRVV